MNGSIYDALVGGRLRRLSATATAGSAINLLRIEESLSAA